MDVDLFDDDYDPEYIAEYNSQGIDLSNDTNFLSDGYINAKSRPDGIRAAFNKYAEHNRRRYANEAPQFGFYHKVLTIHGLMRIYTKEMVIGYDPAYRTIVWSELNTQYKFSLPNLDDCNHFNVYVGNCIYGALIAHDKSILDLADIIKCSKAKVSHMLNGRSKISIYDVMLVAEAFSMTIDELLRY